MPPGVRVECQQIDDIGPIVPRPVAVAEEVSSDGVSVCLVTDERFAKGRHALGSSDSRRARSSSVISTGLARNGLASERPWPAKEPVYPTHVSKSGRAFSGLKLPILPHRHPEEPRHPVNTDPQAVTVPFEHLREADHESGA
jgi:hypothetical protein